MKTKIALFIALILLLVAGCDRELSLRKQEAEIAVHYNNEQGIGYYSACQRCGMPWNKCKSGKGIMITKNRGISPLCKWCEERTTPEQRVRHYRSWYLKYNTNLHQWENIELKVLSN